MFIAGMILSLSTFHVPGAKFKSAVPLHRDSAADLRQDFFCIPKSASTNKNLMTRLWCWNLLGVGGVVFSSIDSFFNIDDISGVHAYGALVTVLFFN